MENEQDKVSSRLNFIEKLHNIDFFMIFLTFFISLDLFLVYTKNVCIINIQYDIFFNNPGLILCFLFIYGIIMAVILPMINYVVECIFGNETKNEYNPKVDVSIYQLTEYAHSEYSQYLLDRCVENNHSRSQSIRTSRLAFNSAILILFNYLYSLNANKESVMTNLIKFDNLTVLSWFCIILFIFLCFIWWYSISSLWSVNYIKSKALAAKVNKQQIAAITEKEKQLEENL